MKKVKFKLRNFLHVCLCTKINKKMLDFVCVYACPQVELLNNFNLGPSGAPYHYLFRKYTYVHCLSNMRKLNDGPEQFLLLS